MRSLSFAKAILEATTQCMEEDSSVYTMGLGVPDPGAIFGTTTGLQEKFGERVLDMPVAENGMTGIAIGSALLGMRPILTHQRVDFMLLSLDQIMNQAAKISYTTNGHMHVPLVIRAVIGRGWGQGPQHSQTLHALFGHIPGLKVVMPFSPYDAKGLLISAIEDNNPVIFLEQRWLHSLEDNVPEEMYRVPLGSARVVRSGTDISLVGLGHTVYELLRAAQALALHGVECEVIDLRSVRPLDMQTVLTSVRKTGRLLMVDDDWGACSLSSEIVANVAENAFSALKLAPSRITWPEHPLPTSATLSEGFYASYRDIACKAWGMVHSSQSAKALEQFEQMLLEAEEKSSAKGIPHDVPNLTFTGPF